MNVNENTDRLKELHRRVKQLSRFLQATLDKLGTMRHDTIGDLSRLEPSISCVGVWILCRVLRRWYLERLDKLLADVNQLLDAIECNVSELNGAS